MSTSPDPRESDVELRTLTQEDLDTKPSPDSRESDVNIQTLTQGDLDKKPSPDSWEDDVEMQMLTQEDLDRKPWKHTGYRDFCKFAAAENDFFAVRRFDELHVRTLFGLQDGLTQLEERLRSMDDQLSDVHSPDVDNGSFREDQPDRKELLDQIHEALTRYDNLLCQYLNLRSAQDASASSVQNMKAWLSNMNQPIEPQEVEFLGQRDLISTSTLKKPPAQRFLETNVGLPFIGWLKRRSQPDKKRTTHDLVVRYDNKKFEMMHGVGMYIAALIMLIGPLWLLVALKEEWHKLISISLLLAIFLAIMNWGIVARPFEILAATAG
ncbi:hypothetical protein CGCSCA4_v004124 [Colletotrichum siamense]|uniref:DUF6594 domain-containing protein n=1 Tax=Colletotrichum siamense TaxID=690259 RepID=A0A9P5EZV6_COLSI|nr:hypothetical protein CGCSCA4_v004124 [Colletotrichum siamense]KAF4863291.1 hypothetical protein CGCSCA2_v003019 [Colletotrichum siamense]